MAAPKRKHIPLLCLALFAIFAFSHYFLSLPPLLPNSTTSRTLSTPTSSSSPPKKLVPAAPRPFSFTVKLLAYDRLPSLSRCLRSLAAADYAADTVNLHVYLDHFKQHDPAPSSDSTAVDERLENAGRILDFLDRFDWKFGEKLVHYRSVNVGLQAQWLEAWWPTSDDEFVFVVEDDLELSPLYYRFLKALIVNYYYNQSNFSPSVYGVSLQRPRFVPGKHGNKIQLDTDTRLFLYQLVGTWGQLLFPRPWKEFRVWYDTHKAKGIKPFLGGMVTNGWYKKLGEKIWTPWFIKFIHAKGYFNIYTNFGNERALSVSHRDAGVNYGKTAGPDSTLLKEDSLDFGLLDVKPLSKLRWYDYCFNEVLPGRIVGNADQLSLVVSSMQKHKPIFVVNLLKTSETITRNLLCHFQRLNVENYIIVSPKSNFLLDLARRGHPVVEADQFFQSTKDSFKAGQSNSELNKALMVNTHVMTMCLESGYDAWILDIKRALVINEPLVGTSNHISDFYANKALGTFYVRSSSSSVKILHKFSHEIVALASQSNGDLVDILIDSLGKQGVKYEAGDEIGSTMRLDSISVNQSSPEDTTKMVFWSSDWNYDAIQKHLVEIGMWLIEGDLSCNDVYCHRS